MIDPTPPPVMADNLAAAFARLEQRTMPKQWAILVSCPEAAMAYGVFDDPLQAMVVAEGLSADLTDPRHDLSEGWQVRLIPHFEAEVGRTPGSSGPRRAGRVGFGRLRAGRRLWPLGDLAFAMVAVLLGTISVVALFQVAR
jgi:hypothetical protein